MTSQVHFDRFLVYNAKQIYQYTRGYGLPIDDTCQRVNMAAAGNSIGDSATNNPEMESVEVEKKPLINNPDGDASGDVKDFRPKATGVPKNQFEDGFYQNFMNPMLSKMEAHVKKNNEILDEITAKLEREREQKRKDDMSQHIPELLKGHGQELPKIMKNLQNLIVYQNYDKETEDESKYVPARLKELDENSEVTILSHSVSSFVSTLEPSHLKHLSNRIITDTSTWVSKLFRFEDGAAYFHDDEREGLLRVCRLALHRRYPKYSTEGYNALYTRQPVIYMNSASRPGLAQYICAQLGLPQSCICTVPHWRNTHKIDIKALEKLIEDDTATGRQPVMIIAYAGTPVLGHVDLLDRIKSVAKKHDMWVHCEGNNIACLTMFRVPTEASPAKMADSMSLNMTGWLGLPSLPYVTLYRSSDPSQARYAGLTYFNPRYKLSALPLWVCLQNLGHEGFVDRVQESIGLAKVVHESIESIPTIKNVVVFNIENPTVVFRYQEKPTEAEQREEEERAKNSSQEQQDEDDDEPPAPKRNPYYDALNIWLCETLKRDCPRVHLDAVELEEHGVCIRFAPMETMHIFDTRKDDVSLLSTCLSHQLAILDATVGQRPEFQEIVDAQDNMRLITLPNWAGLGAVQYIPEQWMDKVDNLPDHGKQEVNVLNSHLVHQLKSADTAFSLGQSVDGLACVRFGLITEETDLEELIALVYTTGKEVEESSKFLETMAEVVRQGIEKANEDLLKENEHKIAQEGVIRQVPIVGSLWNWFSPPPKEAAIKGRTFNLASGQIASTEDTYKYHMQVQESTPQPSPRAKDAPLKASLKPRGRTASSASNPAEPKSPASATEEAPALSEENVAEPATTDEVAAEATEEAAEPTADNTTQETDSETKPAA